MLLEERCLFLRRNAIAELSDAIMSKTQGQICGLRHWHCGLHVLSATILAHGLEKLQDILMGKPYGAFYSMCK